VVFWYKLLPSIVLLQQAEDYVRVSVMVFNATVNNISVFAWLSFFLVEKTGIPGENRSLTLYHIMLYRVQEETGVPEEKHKLLKNFIT
jgi:hypothetical protein